jgi:hypothetical protein
MYPRPPLRLALRRQFFAILGKAPPWPREIDSGYVTGRAKHTPIKGALTGGV